MKIRQKRIPWISNTIQLFSSNTIQHNYVYCPPCTNRNYLRHPVTTGIAASVLSMGKKQSFFFIRKQLGTQPVTVGRCWQQQKKAIKVSGVTITVADLDKLGFGNIFVFLLSPKTNARTNYLSAANVCILPVLYTDTYQPPCGCLSSRIWF